MFDGIIPTNFIASSTAITVNLLVALGDPLKLVIGLLIGAVIIELLMSFHKR